MTGPATECKVESPDSEVLTNITQSSKYIVPEFIRNDYFCDTGHHYTSDPQQIYYVNDPLWDGAGCREGNDCCEFNSPPWFCKDLPTSTSDNIELYSCGNQDLDNEDTPIEMVEIYVQ